ncbi:MAG: tetratricopeptide repeat protein, partial [Balneolaceae bacterium]
MPQSHPHVHPSDSTASELILAGNRHFQVFQYTEARTYYERAVQAAIRENDSRRELLAMWWLVRIENQLFRFEPALEASIRLYELSADRSDTLMMMRALIQEAHIYFETNQNDKAYETYAATRDLADSAGNNYFLALAIRLMGQVQLKNRQMDEAIIHFETSNEIFKELNNTSELILGYSQLALLYNRIYDNKQSIQYSRLAMELSEFIGNDDQLATHLYILSSSYNAMGDYVSALQYAKRSLEIRRRFQSPLRISYSLYQIANLYFKTGQFEQALAYNEECLALEREHSSPVELIYTLTQGAAIFEMLDRHEDARRYSREAIDIGYEFRAWHRINPPIRNLARSYINGDEPLQAIELLNEGMALVETTGQDEILGDFYLFRGIAYNMTGNHDAALADYKNAIAHINTFVERIVPPSYYFHLAQGYRHLGSDSAYTYAREFINSNNRYRENIRLSPGLRAGFMSRFVDQYHEIARWHLEDLSDVALAYTIIEQARARTFAESVADAATDFSSEIDDALLVELNDAEARYQRAEADMIRLQTSEASRELRDAELAYEIVISKIRGSSDLYDRFHNPEPLSLDQARRLIDRNTAVISYAVTKTHLIGIAFSTTRSTHWTVALDQSSGSESG